MRMWMIRFLLLVATAGAGYLAYPLTQGGGQVDVVHPVKGMAVDAVYATGTVEPSVMVPVAPRYTARLMSIQADEGAAVVKGQVLAQMEDTDLQRTLDDLKSAEELARREYNRRSALAKKDAAPKDVVDQAEAALRSARAKVAQAEANLSYMQLLAPEDGKVIRRDGEAGELVTAGTPVLWLSCCAGYRIAAEVDEEDIRLVAPGLKVLIRADAFPGRVFEGKVDSVTPKGDPVSRSYRVRISLPADTPLMIGMTAESNIVIRETPEAILLPASAVQDETVTVLRDGKAVRQKVKTGAVTSDAAEIVSGIGLQDAVLMSADDTEKAEKGAKPRIVSWQYPSEKAE
jgi:multidrug efflux system membrane fusion protein